MRKAASYPCPMPKCMHTAETKKTAVAHIKTHRKQYLKLLGVPDWSIVLAKGKKKPR